MAKYEIETEYKKISQNSYRLWWHWKVFSLENGKRKLIGSDSCIARTRAGAEKEAKKFIRSLDLSSQDTRKTIVYEV